MKSDLTKAVRDLLCQVLDDAGTTSKAADKRERQAIRQLLRIALGRPPTVDEVKASGRKVTNGR